MALSPQEMIELDKEWAKGDRTAAEYAIKSGDYYLGLSNLQECFRSNLMIGLVQWRFGLGDPTVAIREAIAASREALPLVYRFEPRIPRWACVCVGPPLFLSTLLLGQMDQELKTMLCKVNDWKTFGTDYVAWYMDAGIIGALERWEKPEGWDELLEATGQVSRLRLLRETYHTYMDLITSAKRGDVRLVKQAIVRAGELFKERANNEYYSEASTTEGGNFNGYVVDYRLAAIVEHCFRGRKDILAGVDSIHLWKW